MSRLCRYSKNQERSSKARRQHRDLNALKNYFSIKSKVIGFDEISSENQSHSYNSDSDSNNSDEDLLEIPIINEKVQSKSVISKPSIDLPGYVLDSQAMNLQLEPIKESEEQIDDNMLGINSAKKHHENQEKINFFSNENYKPFEREKIIKSSNMIPNAPTRKSVRKSFGVIYFKNNYKILIIFNFQLIF